MSVDEWVVGWLLEFYVLVTSKVYENGYRLMNVHSSQLYSTVPLGNQATSILTRYPTQSHYPDAEVIKYLLMPSAGVVSEMYQFYVIGLT